VVSFGRKSANQPPSDLANAARAFEAVLEELEPAKAALAEAVPGTRLPGRPLGDALEAFVAGAARAEALMSAWRRPVVEAEWASCEAGLARALWLARASLAAPPSDRIGFVGLLEIVQSVLDPLNTFAAAGVALRRGWK
jgi:hypothetical protein